MNQYDLLTNINHRQQLLVLLKQPWDHSLQTLLDGRRLMSLVVGSSHDRVVPVSVTGLVGKSTNWKPLL